MKVPFVLLERCAIGRCNRPGAEAVRYFSLGYSSEAQVIIEAKVATVVGCQEEPRRTLLAQVAECTREQGPPDAVPVAFGLYCQKGEFPGGSIVIALEKFLRQHHFGGNGRKGGGDRCFAPRLRGW